MLKLRLNKTSADWDRMIQSWTILDGPVKYDVATNKEMCGDEFICLVGADKVFNICGIKIRADRLVEAAITFARGPLEGQATVLDNKWLRLILEDGADARDFLMPV